MRGTVDYQTNAGNRKWLAVGILVRLVAEGGDVDRQIAEPERFLPDVRAGRMQRFFWMVCKPE